MCQHVRYIRVHCATVVDALLLFVMSYATVLLPYDDDSVRMIFRTSLYRHSTHAMH